MNNRFADEIIGRVPATELLPFYGVEINRNGFARCPFHNEKTASLKAYPGNRGFVCFGCHAGGSVINFVMRMFGLDFKDAIAKINEDFSLGLPINQKLSNAQKLEQERRAYLAKKERQRKFREQRRYDRAVDAAFDEWHRLDAQINAHGPIKSPDEITPEFAEALRYIAGASYRLDCAEVERLEYEQRSC